MSKRRNEVGEISQFSPSKQQCIVKNERQAEKVLRELSLLFPEDKFQKRVPRVVMKHMVYSCMPNRTVADKQIVS